MKPNAASNVHPESLFDFEFPHTPNLDLRHHTREESTEDEKSKEGANTAYFNQWPQSQSFSTSIFHTSLDSPHRSESALLQNISMDISASWSSPERCTARPMYPDSPSAYARNRRRRAASDQPGSSSRSEARFPLSPSTSSSDEDPFQPLSLAKNSIPLRSISCRKVQSAHGIVHEADHHQESSAVFETSDENTDSKLSLSRACATLEDIVSQYADISPSSSASCTDENGSVGLKALACSTADTCQKSPADADQFDKGYPRADHKQTVHDSDQFYHHWDERAISPAYIGLGTADGDEEWETVPESSRSGFLTPSKLRFRLKKRITVDTSTSSLTGRKSPASPWDPLANSTQTQPRPRLRHRGCLNHTTHNRLSPSQSPFEDKLFTSKHHGVRLPLPIPSDKHSKPSDGRGQHSSPSRALFVSSDASSQKKTHAPHHIISTPTVSHYAPASTSSLKLPSHILQSGSLLPKALDNIFVSTSLSPSAMKTSYKAPQATAGDRSLGMSFLNADITDSGAGRNNRSVTPHPEMPARTTTVNAGDTVNGHIKAARSPTTFDYDTGMMRNQEAQAARLLQMGDYMLNDFGVSRFLRESRLLRHGLENTTPDISFGHRGFRATGSSLANFSSDSTALNRFRAAETTTSGSNYSDDADPPGINTQVTARFIQFLNGNGTTPESTHEYSSLGSVNASTNSTSRSLMLEELEQSFSTADPIISCDLCPSFPLAPEVLGVLHLENMARTPFERLQIGDDGEWLEKAWCFKHGRMEFSRAFLVGNEVGVSADIRVVQRKAGTLLLVFGVLTYLPGGWMLIHSMGKGSPLAATAMAELSRVLVGEEAGVVCCVHPVDAAMARAIEKTVLALVLLGGVCWLAVFVGWRLRLGRRPPCRW